MLTVKSVLLVSISVMLSLTQSGSRSRKRHRDVMEPPGESSAGKRPAMLSLKEAPEISEEERQEILKMVAESEPEVWSCLNLPKTSL